MLKFLDSLPEICSFFSFSLAFVLGLNVLRSPLCNSNKSHFLSGVISFRKGALKLCKALFSILSDLAIDDCTAIMTSGSSESKFSLSFSVLSW